MYLTLKMIRSGFLLMPVAFAALAFVPKENTPSPVPDPVPYAATINAADLKKHLEVLASDAYMGRETGAEGQRMAADYIAKQFEAAGIPQLPSGSYFQNYPLLKKYSGEGTIAIGARKFRFKDDFLYTSGTADASIHSNLLQFVGFGISDSAWNDYANTDSNQLKGRVFVALDGEPMTKDSAYFITGKNKPSGWSYDRRRKMNLAREKGAIALIIISRSLPITYEYYKHSIEQPTLRINDGRKDESSLPQFFVSEHLGDSILKSGGMKKSSESLRQKIQKKRKPQSFELHTPLSIDIIRKGERIEASNVLGFIEGTDKKDEIIVVTAHYDHLGKGEDGVVYNGADDDGSGTVAVIEIAEAFAKAKKEGKGPRRSVLFMTVSGEEKGLLGSDYYSEHPVFPLEKTVCDLNIDMIGRVDPDHEHKDSNYVYIIGSNMLSSGLHQLSEDVSKKYSRLTLDYTYNSTKDKNRYYYRSDHYNFAKHNIPVIFYFNGTHVDYHKETDEVQKISFDLMEKRTRLVFYTAWELAQRDDRIYADKKVE